MTLGMLSTPFGKRWSHPKYSAKRKGWRERVGLTVIKKMNRHLHSNPRNVRETLRPPAGDLKVAPTSHVPFEAFYSLTTCAPRVDW